MGHKLLSQILIYSQNSKRLLKYTLKWTNEHAVASPVLKKLLAINCKNCKNNLTIFYYYF